MALEIKLNQKLTQSLVMTPQLQQAIKLLQLGRHEYLEVIEKELLENPILEDSSDPGAQAQAQDQNGTASQESATDGQSQNTELIETNLSFNSSEDFNEGKLPQNDFKSHLGEDSEIREYLASISDTWHNGSSLPSRYTDDDERPSIEATLTKPEGLTSHLLWQLRTADLAPLDQEMALQIVGNLDRNGYLQGTVEEISEACCRSIVDVEQVLNVIQCLDPPGIGARDLRECLLIQLRQRGFESSLAWRIVFQYLHELELKRYDFIAKQEGVTLEQVYEAIKAIQKLEPRPGRPFVDEAPIYITPDIYVKKIGDEFVITLNEAGMPRLRVNNYYQELLLNGKGKDMPNKEYLQDRLRSATWLIKSIHQRQQTIYKVTESIMKFQRDFLERGVSELKPLVLRDVADDVGMHESTVSRVTTNKYVHTSQGVFELKFFFTSGLRGEDGNAISSESVKDKIRLLIAAEDPRKPLSDQGIVQILKADGVDIARRTVAKYREMMNVLSSSRRKKVF